MITALRPLAILLLPAVVTACGLRSDIEVVREFYLSCLETKGSTTQCISDVREEFLLYGAELHYVVFGVTP